MAIVHQEQIRAEPPGGDPVDLIVVRCDAGHRRETLRDLIGQDYTTDPHGRPVAPGRSISISHSGDLLALVMGANGRVGVDLERVCGAHEIAPLPQGLSPAERDRISALDPSIRGLHFTRLWTAKEAISKAMGLGVSMDLSQIEMAADGEIIKFASLYGKPELARGWNVLHREMRFGPEMVVLAVVVDRVLI